MRKLTTKDLIKRSSISKGRRLVQYRGKTRTTAHLIWNMYHPDDPVKYGEVVHHKNGNRLDDRIGNYQKMTKAKHDRLHTPERVSGLRARLVGVPRTMGVRRKISRAQKGKVLDIDHLVKLSEAHKGEQWTDERRRNHSAAQRHRRESEMKWSPREAIRLRSDGVGKKEIGRRLGIHYSNIGAFFNRRGVAW